MTKFKRFQFFALIICLLPICGFTVSYFTKDYRYTEFRNFYLGGVLVLYLFWGTSLLWGLVNSIFIWTLEKQKIVNKIFWIIISLLPIITIGILIITSFISVHYNNDDIILPGGERIDRNINARYPKSPDFVLIHQYHKLHLKKTYFTTLNNLTLYKNLLINCNDVTFKNKYI